MWQQHQDRVVLLMIWKLMTVTVIQPSMTVTMMIQNQLEQGQLGGVQDEHDAEYDDSSILQNIISQQPDLRMDPTNLIQSMVYNLAQEARANEAINRTQEPIPQESSFVVAARESIPSPRVRMTLPLQGGEAGLPEMQMQVVDREVVEVQAKEVVEVQDKAKLKEGEEKEQPMKLQHVEPIMPKLQQGRTAEALAVHIIVWR